MGPPGWQELKQNVRYVVDRLKRKENDFEKPIGIDNDDYLAIVWREGKCPNAAAAGHVLRFGAIVGQDWHLLIDLGGGLQADCALFVAGHVSIAGIGKLGTTRLWVGLRHNSRLADARLIWDARGSKGRCVTVLILTSQTITARITPPSTATAA